AFDLKNQAFNQITDRPLFWPSRKPAPVKKAAVVAAPVQDALKDAVLLGTFVSGSSSGAILRVDEKKEVIRMAIGESYKGMTLTTVSPISAEFKDSANKSRTLTIDYAKQANQPLVAAPSAPAGAQAEVQRNQPTGQPAGQASGPSAPFDRWVPAQPRNKGTAQGAK
ncbi:MAG: hypothetical protein ACYC3N_01905, partial [Halothiobacillus sp.]